MTRATKDIALAVVTLPTDMQVRNVSPFKLLTDSGYCIRPEEVAEREVAEALASSPGLLDHWVVYSGDKRTDSGWYIQQIPEGWQVGHWSRTHRFQHVATYTDKLEACARFIKLEIEDIRGRCPSKANHPLPEASKPATDINIPVTNPELVHAIEAFRATPTPETEQAMVEALRPALFLVPFEGDLGPRQETADGKTVLLQGATINFPLLSDPQGQPLNIAFTDWEELYRWRSEPNQKTLVSPFTDLASLALNENSRSIGVMINPSGNAPLFINRDRLARLTGHVNPVQTDKEEEVLTGEPAEYPLALAQAIADTAKYMREIKRVWLALMQRQHEPSQSFLVVVEFEGDRRLLFDRIGKAAVPHLPDGKSLDMVPANTPFGQSVIANRKPFFRRGWLGTSFSPP